MWFGNLTLRIQQWLSGAAPAATPFASHATLTNNLVSYWKLDETSGVRYDSVTDSANDLTDNNTVGVSPAGPEGVVANLITANSEYLSTGDIFSSIMDDRASGWSASFWVYWPTGAIDGSTPMCINTAADGNGARWFDVYPWTNQLHGDMFGSPMANNVAFPGYDKWHHICIAYGSDTNWTLYVNGESFYTGTVAVGAATNAYVLLGRIANTYYHGGRIAAAAIWNGRKLVAADVALLFNSGVGLRYAELPAGLLTTLTSYWNLDEVSGARYDSHGANTLTDNNTVDSSVSGPSQVVADFLTANSEYLSKASFVLPDSWTVSGWASVDTDNGAGLFTAVTTWANSVQVAIYQGGANLIYALVGDGSSFQYVRAFRGGGAPNFAGTGFFHYIAWFDAADKIVHLSIDGGSEYIAASALAGTPHRTAATLEIGGLTTTYLDGKMGPTGLWSRVLTPAERTSLFNSGIGKKYSDLTAAEKVSLVSYWNLDETSGNRADSAGSNTLTDNNTVTSVVNAGGAMKNSGASFVAANSESLSKASFVAPDDYTISLWMRPTATAIAAGTTHLFDCGSSWPNNVQFTIAMAGASIRVTISDGSGYIQKDGAGTLVAGQWTHVIVTYTSSDKKARIYMNNDSGNTSNALTGTADRTSATLYIGNFVDGTSYDYDGLLDESAIWSRVLIAQERTDLWNNGKGLFYGD